MFVHYRTQGIILAQKERGEADLLFAIYTKDFGRLEILGKAIRKISSKLRSGAELFYLSEIEFIQAKARKTLTDAIPIEKLENIRQDSKRLEAAYKISEVLDELIKGQEPDENIWQLIEESFKKLNTLRLAPNALRLIYHYFLWNFLSLLGYRPQIHDCVSCQKALTPEDLFFVPGAEGVVYKNCASGVKEKKEVLPETIKILWLILDRNWQILSRLEEEKEHLKNLEAISDYYFRFVLEETR